MISQRLQAVREDDRRRLPAERVEHLPVPLLRRRQLVGGRHASPASSCLKTQILPQVNLFCYGQVESPYGSGQFIKDLQRALRRGRAAWSISRDPGQGRDRRLASRTSSGRGSRRHGRIALSTASRRTCATCSSEIEGYARDYGLDFFDIDLRDPRLRRDERDRRATAASRRATRTGASAWSTSSSPRATSTASRRSTRWSSTTTPAYAYLLEGNSLVDQKLVMAHVYGHVDFFKNNFCFSHDQPQDDRTRWPTTPTRVRRTSERHGHGRRSRTSSTSASRSRT